MTPSSLRVDNRRTTCTYVYVRSGVTMTEQAKFTGTDSAADDRFGWDVSVSGDTIIAGAINDDDRAKNVGAAYVYVRTGTSWVLQAKLTSSDGATGDLMGSSVAVSGNIAVVGSNMDDDQRRLFWHRLRLLPDRRHLITAEEDHGFGWRGWRPLQRRCAVQGNSVVVAAYSAHNVEGATYVYGVTGVRQPERCPTPHSSAKLKGSICVCDDGYVQQAGSRPSGGSFTCNKVLCKEESGDFFDVSTSRCAACGPSHTVAKRKTVCVPCAGGSSDHDSDSGTPYVSCSPGMYSAPGATFCTSCTPDTFTNTSGTNNCTKCPPGKHTWMACADDGTFHDDYGSCTYYSTNLWCEAGGTGTRWKHSWGALSVEARAACCSCGGGANKSSGAKSPSACTFCQTHVPSGKPLYYDQATKTCAGALSATTSMRAPPHAVRVSTAKLTRTWTLAPPASRARMAWSPFARQEARRAWTSTSARGR